MRCPRLDNSVASEDCLLRRQNLFASLEHLCYDGPVKLLPAALQKQDYNLAAHVLVYGLVKASLINPKKSPSVPPLKVRGAREVMNTDFQAPRSNCYGSKRKKQEKE